MSHNKESKKPTTMDLNIGPPPSVAPPMPPKKWKFILILENWAFLGGK